MDLTAQNAANRSGRGREDRHLNFYARRDNLPGDCATALQAMRALAHHRPIRQGYHKVKAADALIAASARASGCGVLHYDEHFERLAEVLPQFVHVWIVPRGSI